MADIRIRFELRFSPAVVRWALAGFLLFAWVPDLGSESVQLTTYYPAPSGVYTQLITTNNTYLARDGGKVGIGTTSLGASDKLTIAGGAIGGNYGLVMGQANWNTFGTGYGGAAIYNDGGTYQKLMIVGNNSGGGVRRVGLWDDVAVNGALSVTGGGTFTGGVSAGTGVVTLSGPTCYDVTYTYGSPAGGSVVLCSSPYYVTMVDGLMSRKSVLNQTDFSAAMGNPKISARCCRCPNANCNPAGF